MILELIASAVPAPVNPQASQQALEILQRVQAKVLLEMWTTIMLCAGMFSVLLAQVCFLIGWRRIGTVFIIVFGYAMTWVPAAIAPWFGYGIMILALTTIVKDSMGGVDRPSAKAT